MAKILLVEDDNNLREIYEARLQAEGYAVVSARDGEEALVVAKGEKPDLVISDIMMPKISGFEMLDILRNTEELKHVKVIMLTALGQSEDQQRADKLGADRYLVKSQVTLEDIVKAAHDLLVDADGPAPAVVAEAAAKPPAAPTGSTPLPVTAPPVAVPAPTPPPPPPVANIPVAQPPADPPAPAPTPTPPPKSDASDNAASDDKLMNDAVNSLIADTQPKPDKSEDKKPVAKSIKISAASSANDAKPPKDEDEATPKDNTETDDEQHNVPIAHKKVIKPIENTDKKDIATLLAEEEAKEAGTTLPSKDDTKADDTDKAEEELADAAKNDNAAASTATEEASVDAKIEDFVAGATSEPTPPSTPKPAPATPAATPAAPKNPSDPNIIAL